MPRPFVVLSCATSLDGYLDDAADERLILSNDADLDRVDSVRAGVDAILVGAGTIRADNPRLLVRSADRRAGRESRGLPPSPLRVVLAGRGDLDPAAALFRTDGPRIVYCAPSRVDSVATVLAGLADVVGAADLPDVLADLAGRGVERLLVEGGGRVLTSFLTAGLCDELQLVVAPFFVGDSRAARFVHDGAYSWRADNRANLLEVRPIGDVVLLRYGRPVAGGDQDGSDV